MIYNEPEAMLLQMTVSPKEVDRSVRTFIGWLALAEHHMPDHLRRSAWLAVACCRHPVHVLTLVDIIADARYEYIKKVP